MSSPIGYARSSAVLMSLTYPFPKRSPDRALGAYLAKGRAGRLGLVAMVITVSGSALFLPEMGVSAFSAPEEGQAYLAGVEGLPEPPTSFAHAAFAASSLLVIVLLFVGNVLLGVAVWRS